MKDFMKMKQQVYHAIILSTATEEMKSPLNNESSKH